MKGLLARGLSAGSGRFRTAPLDLDVPAGAIFGLCGPAGAGKSLLLQAIAGFTPPPEGELALDGRDLGALPPEDRRVGLVLSEGALFPRMSVRQNVAFGARRRGGAVWEDRVAQALAQVGASAYAERLPAQLGPADQRRVALARALASAPDLLLLDDPLAGLEPAARRALLLLLERLLPRSGVPVIYATRDPLDLASLGCEAALLRGGDLVQSGPSANLLAYPADPWVAAYAGFENVLSGWVMGRSPDGLAVAAGRGILAFPDGPELPRGLAVTWGVRACWVSVEAGEGGGPNHLAGRLEQATFDGGAWRLRLDCGVPLLAEVPPAGLPPSTAGLPPHAGDAVTAVLPIEHVRLWPGIEAPAPP